MLAHYLKTTLRNLWRDSTSTLVSVLTLALGLVCFVTAYAVIVYWRHGDAHFANAGRTYVITAKFDFEEAGIRTGTFAGTAEHYAKYLRAEFPELEAVARAYPVPDVSIGTAERGFRGFRVIADQEFLDVFDFHFLAGDPHNALRQPYSVVLTEETARRLFGDEDPMGQRVVLASKIETTVTGVIATVPEPSHMGHAAGARMPFDILASWNLRAAVRQARNPDAPDELPENWFGGYCCLTYAVLPRDGSLSEREFLARLEGFAERHVPAEQLEHVRFEVSAIPIGALAVTDLNGKLFGGASDYISVTAILMLLGGLVLAVACINYANLATARAAGRGRDVGLRMVVGASRPQIMIQSFIEAGLLVTAASVVAVLVFAATAPLLDASVGINVAPIVLSIGRFWLFMLMTLCAVTLAAGAYPAFVLSRLRPVETLRLGRRRAGPRFVATALVGVQFVAANFLLIMAMIISAQSEDLRRTAFGADTDPLLVIDNASPLTGVSTETLLEELDRLPEVRAATATSLLPWSGDVNLGTLSRSAENDQIGTSKVAFYNHVGPNFFSVFGLRLLAGRVFDLQHGEDVLPDFQEWSADRPLNVIVDRRFALELGFESPAAAVDQTVYFPMPEEEKKPAQPAHIIGVVEDRSLHFRGAGSNGNIFTFGNVHEFNIAQISRADVPAALEAIDAMWQRLSPLMPRSRRFLDDVFNESYEAFDRVNQIFVILTLAAFFISLVGLFGMAIQVTNRRLHEIGVRKTLGASTRRIIGMLLGDFSGPVIIAGMIAWPLAYIGARLYLNVFMHRILITPWPFFVSLLVTVGVACLAVGGQAYRAARTQPVRVLRTE
jgi:putative ABC transport system permease protein